MKRFPYYIWLVFLTGVLSDYAVWPGLTHLSELGMVVALGLAIPAATLVLFWIVCRNARQAGLSGFLFLLLLFFYPKLHGWLESWPLVGSHRVLIPATLLLFGGVLWRILHLYSPLERVTLLLNVVTAGALLYPVGKLGMFHVSHIGTSNAVAGALGERPNPQATQRPSPLPDIYYLIFDRYGSPSVLATHYGHDNNALYDFLRQKGFYVAPESHSNYLRTAFSLPASLNMTYLDSLAAALGPDNEDWSPLYKLLEEHVVGRFLQQQGYTFIHAGSWWWPTRRNRLADENVNWNAALPMPNLRLLVDFTMLKPLGQELGIEWLDLRRQQWLRENYKFERIAEIARRPEPTFVFAHFILPHEPFVFDRDGSFLPEDRMWQRSEEENYRNQLLATNEKLRWLIERLLAHSTTPPVILLQADEGPAPERFRREGIRFRWRTATDEELREKTGILNAYLLPGVESVPLYPSITPVNSFRVVFNAYFGTNLPLLPDRIFAHEEDRHPYRLFEVTDKVRGSASPPL